MVRVATKLENSEGEALQTEIATIYRCIDIRAGAVASVPFTVYQLEEWSRIS